MGLSARDDDDGFGVTCTMELHDDNLERFEAQGATLPKSTMEGFVENDGADDLAKRRTPVAIVQAEQDEFIKPEHPAYLARMIPGAEIVRLSDASHFAPLQRPEVFNAALLRFLKRIDG